VILCGGAGERLWPMSRPELPKPFLRLTGRYSGFQAAVLRARPLVSDGKIIIVGSHSHEGLIEAQLLEIGVEAQILLEPSRRDTAAAIVAAAGWVADHDPKAMIIVLPADHHIPDDEAFGAAIRATLAPASGGAIVTLGVKPAAPSPAYGYILPEAGEAQVRPIERFLEKPNPARAAQLMAAGALWNIGVFVARAETINAEARKLAPPLALAVEKALADLTSERAIVHLGAAFNDAPSLAFDRAVMEKTGCAAVLPVTFAWSDLGAWDAVLAAGPRDHHGSSLGPGVEAAGGSQILGRAAAGMSLNVVGISRVVVVAEPNAVLVCGLDAAQQVGTAMGRVATLRFVSLAEATKDYDVWLRTNALPLWATVGVDPANGAFREALTRDGVPVDPFRRTRVQARQTFVFASAAAEKFPGPWLSAALNGMSYLRTQTLRPDGLFAARVDLNGVASTTAGLYDHAFILLALAGLANAGEPGVEAEAVELLGKLSVFRHRTGFRETGSDPFQANAQMHLLEAALAWEAVGKSPVWSALCDEIVDLALSYLIDDGDGALREVFDADWKPLQGEASRVEPGHQFEWAWLLVKWGRARSNPRGEAAARQLFTIGRLGFDDRRGVVVNSLQTDLSVKDSSARLWPQCEYLKAALILDEKDVALGAANGLFTFADMAAGGVWRERMRADGSFIDEPAPATSLYHLYLAINELRHHTPNRFPLQRKML